MDGRDVDQWEDLNIMDAIGPSFALAHTIEKATGLKPTAYMLPLSLAAGAEMLHGKSIIRGDRVALVYEPLGVRRA